MNVSHLFSAVALLSLSNTAFAAPWSFLEAFPVNPGPVDPTKPPRQFMMNLFNDQYLCERSGPAAKPNETATPAPTPSAAVQVFCDGSQRIVVKKEGRVMMGDEFSWSSECRRAVQEFQEFQGCFCGKENTIRCLGADLRLTSVGGGFTMRNECQKALRDMAKTIEVKFRN